MWGADPGIRGTQGVSEIRILINFDKRHRVYGEAIGQAIRDARPDAEVVVSEPGTFEAESERLDPHLVISGVPLPSNPGGGKPAWIELSTEPDRPTRIRGGERYWESTNPSLGELLAVVESTENSA